MDRPKFSKNWGEALSDADVENMAVRRGRQRATFEEAAVKEALYLGGREAVIYALSREIRESLDAGARLTFSLMRARVNFPLYLGVAKLYHIDKITLVDLYKRPTKLQIWRAYHEWRDESLGHVDDEGAGGVIFSWPEVAKFMCLHNFPHAVDDGHTRLSFAVNHKTYILEPLKQVLDAVGWSRS